MSRRTPILLAVLLATAALTAWLWRQSGREPMDGFKDFPWTYVTEAGMGTDPQRVLIVRGSVTGPASVPNPADGQTAWPAYVHPAARMAGQPVIFPLIPAGTGARTPVIPGLQRPLTAVEMASATRYLTDEGRQRMDSFKQELAR